MAGYRKKTLEEIIEMSDKLATEKPPSRSSGCRTENLQ